MNDPILELNSLDDIELNSSLPNDIQVTESQEEDLLIELTESNDVMLADGADDDIILEDSYAGEIPYDYYNGPYVVTPILYNEQTLQTMQKIMRNNVTVEAIPVTTTNPHGGQTVVIG